MKNSIKFIFKMPNAYHQVALDYFFYSLHFGSLLAKLNFSFLQSKCFHLAMKYVCFMLSGTFEIIQSRCSFLLPDYGHFLNSILTTFFTPISPAESSLISL